MSQPPQLNQQQFWAYPLDVNNDENEIWSYGMLLGAQEVQVGSSGSSHAYFLRNTTQTLKNKQIKAKQKDDTVLLLNRAVEEN